MRPGLYLAMCDIINLSIRKVILQPKSSRVVAYFDHTTLPQNPIFTASLSFHAKDKGKWYTSFSLYTGNGVTVDGILQEKVKTQMTKIFSPYFDSLMSGERLW